MNYITKFEAYCKQYILSQPPLTIESSSTSEKQLEFKNKLKSRIQSLKDDFNKQIEIVNNLAYQNGQKNIYQNLINVARQAIREFEQDQIEIFESNYFDN